ncbi:putative nuclease HARBI1 [Saccostrea cucullata]|uniref:putative nuclease HARBI1 n=1 Tax=Saccostrea cuccullata TaxID=36930 RepID=UPI002ED1BBD5
MDPIALHHAMLLQHHALKLQQDSMIMLTMLKLRRKKYTKKKYWVVPWLRERQRDHYGQYTSLMKELRLGDEASYRNYLRMTPEMFDELLTRVGPRIEKMDTNYRRAIEAGLKLTVTLRHLATGIDYPSLSYDFRVSRHTIATFIPLVCQAIVDEYKNEVIPCPTSAAEWKAIADEFERRWNVPHAIGALDGKHVAIRKPASSGSLYYNYKKFCSIVLLALVDANAKFLWIDVGGLGHQSDAQIFNASELHKCIVDGSVHLPAAEPMTNDDVDVPFFILGDDAFALKPYLMKPYTIRGLTKEETICNYRISRGRRVVENAFGILSSRFRCLLTTLQQNPDNCRLIVEACVCLHNIMRKRYPALQNADMDMEDLEHIMSS